MATAMAPYEEWLTEKLKSLSPEFDTDVFVSYIVGILDTDSTAEEVTESIEDILSQILGEDDSSAACREILEEWTKHSNKALLDANSIVKKDAGDMLSEIMEQQTLATVKESTRTAEEKAHKQAILAQYAHISDGEGSNEEEEEFTTAAHKGKGESADNLLERNTNAASVMEAQQAQREQSKQEHERKKEKDKQDREAQRQKQQQRKEAEKKRTQKGERRR